MESWFWVENAPYTWLAIGALFLVLEVGGASGIGFFFAALGALVTALGVHYGMVENWGAQFAVFFAASALWALLLWIPLKRIKAQKHSGDESFNNMIGDEAVVVGDAMQPAGNGSVRWSGTVMRAKLAADSAPVLPQQNVTIIRVEGTVLVVSATPK